MANNHAKADRPYQGEGSGCQLATVTYGRFRGKTVGIMVEYTDGWCICDMGGDDPMEIIPMSQLHLWTRVKSVSNRDGVTVIEMEEENSCGVDERI